MRSSMPEININRKRERNNPQRSRDLRQLKKKNKINFRFRIGNQAIHELTGFTRFQSFREDLWGFIIKIRSDFEFM